MSRPDSRSGEIALIVVLTLLLSVPVHAAAQTPSVPDSYPSADQLVESVPTSRGPHATRVGKDETAPLPPAIGGRLHGSSGAGLEQIATSATLGAPPRELPAPAARVHAPSIPAAVVGVTDAGGDRLLWLLLALLFVTGVVGGTAGHRHTKRRAAGT